MDTNTAAETCSATAVTEMDGRTAQYACTKDQHPAREAHAHVANGVTVFRWWGPTS
jgi:hypothetical protein